jgi:cytochrome c oxidase subunit 2
MIERLLPFGGSEHAAAFDAVLTSVHLHIAIQVLAWGSFFVYCLVRFRRGRHPKASHAGLPPTLPTLAIAFVVLGDAALLVTAALPVWLERGRVPEGVVAPLELQVVAEQFAWHIHYPGPDGRFGVTRDTLISATNPLGIDRTTAGAQDDIGLSNVLTVPVGRTVIVHLSSRDVVHSFTLNEMRVKQDATPGLVARTWFTPRALGRWEIACSQLCGLGHYRMRGTFTVMTSEQWDVWLRQEVALVTARAP